MAAVAKWQAEEQSLKVAAEADRQAIEQERKAEQEKHAANIYNGRALFRKRGDGDMCLRYVTHNNCNNWMVSTTRSKDNLNQSGFCYGIEKGTPTRMYRNPNDNSREHGSGRACLPATCAMTSLIFVIVFTRSLKAHQMPCTLSYMHVYIIFGWTCSSKTCT